MRTLGVIGGLGPMATALFVQMVIEMTEAEKDQEHIEMILYHAPSIPDRTSYILGESSQNPEKPMSAIGQKLAADGAEIIAIPCVTACHFYKEMSEKIPVPMINLIDETAAYLEKQNVHTAGLMATDGTLQSGLFQAALQARGIQVVLPEKEKQRDIMHLIYQNVKAAKPIEMDRFGRASAELRKKGAQVILLGCTELSIIKREEEIGPGYLDVMQVLAKTAVEQCGVLKENYQQLITQ